MKYRTIVEKKAGSGAPSRIIFYRDGVSEGQFKQVLDFGAHTLIQCTAASPDSPFFFFRTQSLEARLCRLKDFAEDHRHCCRQTPPRQVLPPEPR